jgi:hypothetical protein
VEKGETTWGGVEGYEGGVVNSLKIDGLYNGRSSAASFKNNELFEGAKKLLFSDLLDSFKKDENDDDNNNGACEV